MESPIIRLLVYAQQQTASGNDFFFDYSGHIDNVSIRGHYGRWHRESCMYTVINRFDCKVSDLDHAKVDRWIGFFNDKLEQGS